MMFLRSIFASLCIVSTTQLVACAASDTPDAPVSSPEEARSFDAAAVWKQVRQDFDLFYAYRDLRGFDADIYLDRVGDYVSQATTRAEFRRRLNQATYAFTDPHLGFGPLDNSEFNILPTATDLQIGLVDGLYTVLDVRADSAAHDAGVRTGWTLTHIEGTPTAQTAAQVFSPLIEKPSDTQLSYAATLAANGRRTGLRSLQFITESGDVRAMELDNPRDFATEVMQRVSVETRWITQDDGTRIAVLRINNRLGDNDLIAGFDTALAAVSDADGLILDLRNTPSGGNAEVGRSIMGHFVTEAMPFQVHERPSLEREFTVPRRYVEYVLPREPAFDPARTVVLGGYWTGSMGEGIVIGMDAIGVQTIASDMGDLLGGMSRFSFADQAISLSIPTETLFHVDGTPREDFEAATALPSADSDENGSDPAMRAAIRYLNAKP